MTIATAQANPNLVFIKYWENGDNLSPSRKSLHNLHTLCEFVGEVFKDKRGEGYTAEERLDWRK